jgi:mono/diheme cytochrome c family protein
MGLGTAGPGPAAQGRALYETRCAPCHGITGRGGYVSGGVSAPSIRGKAVSTITAQARHGGEAMPVFSEAVLDTSALEAVAGYVSAGLAAGDPGLPPAGLRELDPIVVGFVVWVALALLMCALAVVLGERRGE